MMSPSAVKATKAAAKHRKDAEGFLTTVKETTDGINVSADSPELAGHVDEVFDGHAESAGGVGKAFTKFSEHITDDGGDADDGVLEDSAEAVVGAMENLANSDIVQKVVEAAGPAIGAVHDTLREGAKHTTEAVHRAARAGGVVSRGMPETKDAEEVAEGYVEAIETKAEDLAEGLTQSAGGVFDTLREKAPAAVLDAVGPSGAVEEAVEECAKQVGETAMEVMGEAAIEEIAESVAEVIPGVGVVGPSCHLILGTGKAAAGVSSLLTGGVIAVVGGVYGAAAALFDGGAAWGKVMNVSRGPSGWGASMAAEGGLIATKGAVGYVGQVPGSQVATIPAKVACKLGAKWINQTRNSSREVDVQGDDDFEGVVMEEEMQAGRTYEIFSADGKRLLRATNTKSSRGLKLFGYTWGGYSLTFEGPSPSPSSSTETQQEQQDDQEREGQEEQEQEEGEQTENEEDEEQGEERSSSYFSFSGSPGAYRLHSGMHGGNTVFFLGVRYPAEWVVWDVAGKTDGKWEKMDLRWREGGKKFTISGHGGQHVRWKQSKGEGVFRGTRTESKAAEFVLRDKSSSSGGGGGGSSS